MGGELLTQTFDAVLEFEPGSDLTDASVAVSRAAALLGLGIAFGIGRVYPCGNTHGLAEELSIFRDIVGESGHGLVFALYSSPLEQDIHGLFESELAPSELVNPAASRLLKFLRDVWSMSDVTGLVAVIKDFNVYRREDLREGSMTFEALLKHMADYWAIQAQSPGGAGGVFRVKKELPPRQARLEDVAPARST